MIFVDRNRVAVPAALDGPNSKGGVETTQNIEHFRRKECARQKFSAYRDPTVVTALSELFHRKCAYCETLMLGQQPGDVDHYRPKATVVHLVRGGERVYEPGYFWLAASWDNLLPSCLVCNRPSRQEVPHEGRVVVGKATQFPIAEGSRRAKYPEPLVAVERRLLLNPCEDDPQKHLTFLPDGSAVAVRTRAGPSAMGQETIRVCALNRIELIQARHAAALRVDDHLMMLMAALRRKQAPDPITLAALDRAMEPTEPFSAFIRKYVEYRLAQGISGLKVSAFSRERTKGRRSGARRGAK